MIGAERCFSYHLFDPEKPQMKKFFVLLVGCFLALLYYQRSAEMQFLRVLSGNLHFLIILLLAFYFGYVGLVTGLVLNSYNIFIQIYYWVHSGDLYYASVVGLYGMMVFAAGLIAVEVEKEKKKKALLETLSVTDGVSGLYNHRYFQQRLEDEIARASRNGESLVLCMIDIDQFKMFNDLKGHGAGDEAIEQTGKVIKEAIREHDVVCRYGGDEFAVILPACSEKDAVKVIEKIKEAYKKLNLSYFSFDSSFQLTLSVGYSVYPTSAVSKGDLLSQADSALYHAKSMGRDRIEQYQQVIEEISRDLHADRKLEGALKALIQTVSGKDKYTFGHSERVANYAALIGKALNMTDEQVEILRIEALLHDIGKIDIPGEILNKKGSLTKEEFEVVKKHPTYSANIVLALPTMGNIIDDIRMHHERFDGRGYPDGVCGTEIPIGARILAIADAFDAMQSDRPYRKAMSLGKSIQELVDNAGTQFDPALVKVFVSQFCEREAS